MSKLKVLYVCHNHPDVRPGGAETYALELFHGIRSQGEIEPVFVARGEPRGGRQHAGTQFGLVNGDPHQYFFYTDGYAYDWLQGTVVNKEFYTKHFRDFLLAHRPDIVHFQHTLFFGYDMIRQVRATLGDVPILYTLHEYMPICHRQGQMVRTLNANERCETETPLRCHECFPDISSQAFFMRKRFIQSHLSLVDLFLAPSHFLRERYIAWGIPAEKIRFEEYGRLPVYPEENQNEHRPRNRFAYFGQLNPFKGITVLLNAMQILGDQSPGRSHFSHPDRSDRATSAQRKSNLSNVPHLWIHGANLDIQAGAFQNEVKSLLEATKGNVTMVGRYEHADLPALMAKIDWVIVPSIWWENSPLVIQEAFAFSKPVICSNVGGMAEKVADRVNGLHFRAGDPVHLAEVVQSAATSVDLWDQLRSAIPSPHCMQDHVQTMVGIYQELIQQKVECKCR